MSSWPDIPPEIIRLAIDGGEELVRYAWNALTGKETDEDALKAKVDKIRREAQEAFVQKMTEALAREAAAANLTMQLMQLGPLQQHVLDSFEHVDPNFPKLNEILNIEIVKPGESIDDPPAPGFTRFEGTIDPEDK